MANFDLKPGRVPQKRVETFMIQEERTNLGYPMTLTLIHYEAEGVPPRTEVYLESNVAKIESVDLKVLKRIIELAEERAKK